MTQKTSSDFISGAALFLLALGLRLAYFAGQASHNPLFDFPVVDASVYSSWADEIVRGHWWWPDLRNYLPVYPWFLAICKWFFYGDNPWSVKVIQALLASLAAVLLADVTRRLFGRRAGMAAGLLLACNWLLIVYDGERYAESLCLFGLVLGLHQLLCAAPGWRRTLLAGVACALACGCRPNLIPLIPLAAFWIFRTGDAWRRRCVHAAAVLGLAALVFLPVLLHNHRISGRWMLRAQQNWNLYAAVNPAFGGLHPAGGIAFDKCMKEPVLAGCYSHPDQDAYWQQKAGQLLREHPQAVLDNFLFRRGGIFLDATEWSQEFDVYAFRACSAVLRLPWPGFGWIFPLACAGLFSLWAQRKAGACAPPPREGPGQSREAGEDQPARWRAFAPARDRATELRYARRLLLACLLTAILFTFLFKVTGRYRFPVTLFLIPFAGAGVDALGRALAQRQWKRLLAPAGVLCAAGLLCWPDWPGLRHRQTALHAFYIGQKYQQAGEWQQAEAAFRLAARQQPWSADASCELARLLWKEQRLPEAMTAVGEALQREPEFWRAWNLKGALATAQNQSLAIYPPQPEPWMLRTEVYARTGRWTEENAAFQQALQLGAGADFQLTYGVRLQDKGLYPEARRQFEAVACDPAQPRIDRARASLLTGCLLALPLQQPAQAAECWRTTAARFADVPFVADQAAFLCGDLPEAQYRARAGALNIPAALEYYDFNCGVASTLQHRADDARKAFRACLARGGFSADTPQAPAVLPQKWAWEQLQRAPAQSAAGR